MKFIVVYIAETNILLNFIISDFGYSFVRNQKGGMNLCYGGFEYRCKRNVNNKSNWICSKSRHDRLGLQPCAARISLDSETGIVRLGKNSHNHQPNCKKYL